MSAGDAARFAIRPLVPGEADALRAAVEALGGGSLEGLSTIARHGTAQVLALRGLAADETRIVERELRRLGGEVLSSPAGDRALLIGPLAALGDLPGRLREFGRRTEPLGDALGSALAGAGSRPRGLRAGGRLLPAGERTLVVGVVNATPDSFSGDGTGGDDDGAAVARGVALAAAGADLVEVGGESTRPHAEEVSADEELRRVVPVIERLARRLDVPVGVDTRKAAVARASLAAGATVVNDVWGLRTDPEMAQVCAASDAAIVLMHNQRGARYAGDLLEEVCAVLHRSLAIAEAAGIAPERIAVDPGFGFGKTPAQNLELVRRLGELRGLNRPILLGPSRKSTLGLLLADEGGVPPPDRRLEATLAVCVLAVAAGADLVRVHDVAEVRRACRVADALVRGTPAELLAAPAPGPTG